MPLNDIKNVCNREIKETQTKVFLSRPITRPRLDKTNATRREEQKEMKTVSDNRKTNS